MIGNNLRTQRSLFLTGISTLAVWAAQSAHAQSGEPDAANTANSKTSETEQSVLIDIDIRHIKRLSIDPQDLVIEPKSLSRLNTRSLENYLNTLPGFLQGFDHTTNARRNSRFSHFNARANVDMLGLGEEHTSVRLGGHRISADYADQTGVDFNNIPVSMLGRTIVSRGPGTAVSGSNASAGVVDLTLGNGDAYETAGASYEISQHGDAQIANLWASNSFDLPESKGMLTLKLDYTKRQSVLSGERDFSEFRLRDTGSAPEPRQSTNLLPEGVTGRRFLDFTFGGYSTDGTSCTPPAGGSSEGLNGQCLGAATFDANGQIIPFIRSGPNSHAYSLASFEYIQTPLERFAGAATLDYSPDLKTDIVLQALFSAHEVATQLAPSFFSSTLDIEVDTNPFLTPEAREIFRNADFFPSNIFQGRLLRVNQELGPLRVEGDTNFVFISADIEKVLSENWDFAVRSHFLNDDRQTAFKNDFSEPLLRDLVNGNNCNIFGAGTLSADCISQIKFDTIQNHRTSQFEIAGEFEAFLPITQQGVSTLFGMSYRRDGLNSDLYRENNGQRITVTDVTNADVNSLLDAARVDGTNEILSVYGDLYAPLELGSQKFDLRAAYRYSEFDPFGKENPLVLIGQHGPPERSKPKRHGHAYQAQFNWEPTTRVELFAGYERGFRLPSVYELYEQGRLSFAGSYDPCSTSGIFGIVASFEQCTTLEPSVSPGNYGFLALGVGTSVRLGGNSKLEPEEIRGYRFGISGTLPGKQSANFSAQYYSVEIDKQIDTYSSEYILDDCYVGGNLSSCNRVFRRASSDRLDGVDATNYNKGASKRLGVLVSAEKNFERNDSGEFQLSFDGEWILSQKYSSFDGVHSGTAPRIFLTDFAGTYGAGLIPEWKHVVSASYQTENWALHSRWRYIGGVRTETYLTDPAAADARFVSRFNAQNYFDISGEWRRYFGALLSVGVLNVLDNDPPVTGVGSEQANTFPSTYDPIGRRFFVSARAEF